MEEEERGHDIQLVQPRISARILSVSVRFAYYDVGYLFSRYYVVKVFQWACMPGVGK